MSFGISQSGEQKSKYVCRNEKRFPVPRNNRWVKETKDSHREEQNMSDNPCQQTIGTVLEEIPSRSQLPSTQFAGEELIESHLENYPSSICKRHSEIKSWSVYHEEIRKAYVQ
jgi:hypothetical protein